MDCRNRRADAFLTEAAVERFWRTKKAPVWLIIAVVLMHLGFAPFFNFVVFPNHWLSPVSSATLGLVNATLQANLFYIVVVIGGLLFLVGRMPPADVGWRRETLPAAIVYTLLLWAAANLLMVAVAAAKGLPLAFNESWAKPGVTRTIGAFLAQIFGNALCEETIFRGFLTIQVMLLLRPLGKSVAVITAVVLVQAFFASIHIPMLLNHGTSWTDILEALPMLFLAGVMFAVIYLATGNLFVAVGGHALVDAYMLIPRDAFGLSDNFGFVYLVMVFAGALLWRFARLRFRPALAGGS
jgi:uncharacterized protein